MAAALNRFIRKSSDPCRSFFESIKTSKRAFQWNAECDRALTELKGYMGKVPVLVTPREEEDLHLYLAVSDHAVSSALVRKEGPDQQPIYYSSKTMLPAEIKICRWSMELANFDIRYEPQTAIKGQALADFVAELTPTLEAEAQKREEASPTPDESTPALPGFVLKRSPQRTATLYAGESGRMHLNSDYGSGDSQMLKYLSHVLKLQEDFKKVDFWHIGYARNAHADALAALGSACSDVGGSRTVILGDILPQASSQGRRTHPIRKSPTLPTASHSVLSLLRGGGLPPVVIVEPVLHRDKDVGDEKDLVGAVEKRVGFLGQDREVSRSVGVSVLKEPFREFE
ncbi:hypothetical protein Vadar_006734 [Vaccinium darrowii]|uniref:Uncharacterized protein n=1 Tax=Vaccinium darrowii TaxID=229202 RepID=A0ACB7Y6P5_9ERIC|nr:hypothetical protein Vadar_006734 [Vaccinium darrowii]